jgi:hypothetical protein
MITLKTDWLLTVIAFNNGYSTVYLNVIKVFLCKGQSSEMFFWPVWTVVLSMDCSGLKICCGFRDFGLYNAFSVQLRRFNLGKILFLISFFN